MSRHLDLDALADLLAGEGADTHVRHVAGCPACSSALDDLDRAQEPVRRALAGLSDPAVPGDLAARLDAALLLAWEQDDVAAPPDGDDPGPGRVRSGGSTVVVPLHRPRRRRTPDRLLAGAAGVVLLLVVGVAALALSRQGGHGDSSASTASGALAGPAAAGAVPTSSTGTDYGSGRDALAAALPQLLQGTARRRQLMPGSTGSEAGSDPLARLRDPRELAGCLTGLLDPVATGQPVALDYARYAGRPALVAVLPAADPTRLDVYVLGAGCRAGSPQTLLFTRLARPS